MHVRECKLHVVLVAAMLSFLLSLLAATCAVAQQSKTPPGLSLPQLQSGAEKGDATAQWKLGQAYSVGAFGLERSPAQAIEWFLKAAESEDESAAAEAHVRLSHYFLQNTQALDFSGVKPDVQRGLRHLDIAAAAGHPLALFNFGVLYEEGVHGYLESNLTLAVKHYGEAAQRGYPSAMVQLGICFIRGRGLEQNFETGINWLSKAAEKGTVSAQLELGLALLDPADFARKGEGSSLEDDGDGLEDLPGAERWLKTVADNEAAPRASRAKAAAYLGSKLYLPQKDQDAAAPRSVAWDVEAAMHYLELSGEQGSTEAAKNLKTVEQWVKNAESILAAQTADVDLSDVPIENVVHGLMRYQAEHGENKQEKAGLIDEETKRAELDRLFGESRSGPPKHKPKKKKKRPAQHTEGGDGGKQGKDEV